MNIYEAIRAVALHNILFDNSDSDYQYRKVCRWYSKEFHTPLKDVYEMPIEDVLLNYWEQLYEDWEDDDKMGERALKIEARYLTETDEEKESRKLAEYEQDLEDDAFLEQSEQQILKESTPKQDLIVPNEEIMPDIKMNFLDDNLLQEMLEGQSIAITEK